METTRTDNEKNIAALVHLSTFSKYFFPFANFFAPLLLWTFNKDKEFVSEHGREAVNFQLSILLYTLVIGILCLPFFVIFAGDFVSLVEAIDHHTHHVSVYEANNISGYIILFSVVALLLFGLFVFELYAVISATIHANKGQLYKYPLSIPFIKTTSTTPVAQPSAADQNQSENEHSS